MEIKSYEPGTPCWVDLGTTSTDGAAEFYGALFGWEIGPADPQSGGYRMAVLRGKPVTGIGPLPMPGMPPSWTTYVSVDDAAATAAKVSAGGGTVYMPPMDVFTFGRMAVFGDPLGATFAVWEPGSHVGARLKDEPGTLTWNELMTTDVQRSKEFYGAVFGWTASEQLGDGMDYTSFKAGDMAVAGMMLKPATVPPEVPPCWTAYFAVDDVDATCSLARERGGNVMMGPINIGPGRMAVLADPQGAVFDVLKLSEPMPQ